MIHLLLTYFKRFASFTESEQQAILESMTTIHLKKVELLLVEGCAPMLQLIRA